MDIKKIKIIFFGTSDFANYALQSLFDNSYNIIAVATQPDRPVGRKQKLQKSPVKVLAETLKIPIISAKELAQLNPDLGILFAYGEIIPEAILKKFKYGILNLHPSLLPKYRGSSPAQAAILNNDKITGVSIIKLDEKMDHGPIVAQEKIRIKEGITAGELLDKLAKIGSNLLIKNLPDYLAGKINLKAQDHHLATYCKLLRREDGRIDWQKFANEVICQYRAFYPWPGIFTFWRGKRLKIVKLSEFKGYFAQKLIPGAVFLTSGGQLAVVCKNSAIILEKLQLEGRKEMGALEFLQGYKNIINAVLE